MSQSKYPNIPNKISNKTMQKIFVKKYDGYLLAAFTVLGAGTTLLPHPPGLATTGALAMITAYYLPLWLRPIPLIITVAAAQIFATSSLSFSGLIIVLAAHILAMVALWLDKSSLGLVRYGRSACVHAIIFYLVSNLAPMALSYYPNTPAGWSLCYIAGLPFLGLGLLANLVYGGVGFLATEQILRTHTRLARQAH